MRFARLKVLAALAATVLGVGTAAVGAALPAQAANCSPASTSTWTSNGSHDTIAGMTYQVVVLSTGTCDWTVPTGVTKLTALVAGGGGGGGGASGAISTTNRTGGAAGGGGGGAAVATGSGSVTPGQTLTIVVGAGGAAGGGGTAGNPGGCGLNGGNSSISALSLTANGGHGGVGGGLSTDCTTENRVSAGGAFIAASGGDSANGYTGGASNGRNGGSGASITSNGSNGTPAVTGSTVTFAGNASGYGYGGGGGDQDAPTNGDRQTDAPGSGGGGGREPQYINATYTYGYSGSAGIDGTAILLFNDAVGVTATSPASFVVGGTLPSITYTSTPTTSPSDWSVEPTCALYSPSDLNTPLTSVTEAGTYVTKCSGGVLASGQPVYFLTGTVEVTPISVTAESPQNGKFGESLPTVGFTTDPALSESDWQTLPTCGIYAPGDLTTPLTATPAAGTYVTHCSGGVTTSGVTNFVFVDGTFVVESALPDTGLAWMSLAALVVVAGIFFLFAGGAFRTKWFLRLWGIDVEVRDHLNFINASFERMDRNRRRNRSNKPQD